ncbi:hemagglutinin repeat-containing protein [Brucella tritici]|uniref:hemagglutinin repeat-containing protein n=1 Tax=Brucella tritici TaxID=94626 RepID=UPI0015928825|nr:hemagglutinin repeat-containing protein [Brucella tritici]
MATIAGVNGKYVDDVLNSANEKNNWNPEEQLISGSLDIGFEYQKNSAEGSASIPVSTTIRAGDTVIVEAGRDINAVGAQIGAGYNADGTLSGGRGDIALIAGNDINLESAKATTENSSKNVSGGLSIDFLSPGISASFGRGKGNDKTVTNVNTHVAGSGTVYVNSGNDTNLRGATVSGETVIADVGGDLNIESQLDTATANAKQVGAGLVSGPIHPGLQVGCLALIRQPRATPNIRHDAITHCWMHGRVAATVDGMVEMHYSAADTNGCLVNTPFARNDAQSVPENRVRYASLLQLRCCASLEKHYVEKFIDRGSRCVDVRRLRAFCIRCVYRRR